MRPSAIGARTCAAVRDRQRSTARHAQLDEARYATRSRGQTVVTASEGARWLNARAADRDERRSARALGTIERDAGTRALLEEEPRA